MQTPLIQLIERLEARKKILTDFLEDANIHVDLRIRYYDAINVYNFAITQAKELLEVERDQRRELIMTVYCDGWAQFDTNKQPNSLKYYNEQFKND